MNPRIMLAVGRRVLRQLSHDPRTIALLLVVPVALDRADALRARRRERVRADRDSAPRPVPTDHDVPGDQHHDAPRADHRDAGAADDDAAREARPAGRLRDRLRRGRRGPGAARLGRRVRVPRPRVGPFERRSSSSLAIANGLLGMSLGLFVSAFAQSEFQAVQFMPMFLLPQILLCGLIQPRDEMAPALETASDFLPVTYAFDALARAAGIGDLGGAFWADVVVVIGTILLALAAGRRRCGAERPERGGVRRRPPDRAALSTIAACASHRSTWGPTRPGCSSPTSRAGGPRRSTASRGSPASAAGSRRPASSPPTRSTACSTPSATTCGAAERLGAADTTAFATSAVRDASNGDAFLAELRERFSLERERARRPRGGAPHLPRRAQRPGGATARRSSSTSAAARPS